MALWLRRGRQKPPERTESSLTLLVNLKEHVLLVELLGRRADGQLNEGAAIQAEPESAFVQDLPGFRRDANGQVFLVGFVHFVCSIGIAYAVD